MGAPHNVAVIGCGVAGLTAAYVAAKSAHVTLFEADDRLGGHADTHEVDGLAIDTGFIVHNERTYPTLLRMFGELGVATQESEMSMSVRDDATGLEYAGALGPRGLFPTARNLARPAYLRMLAEIPRFHRRARSVAAEVSTTDSKPRRGGHHAAGVPGRRAGSRRTSRRHFMESLVAAVWSCDPARRAGLPGPLPVRVPRPPRHARRLRLAAVAHRHRRLARVRRPGRRRRLHEVRTGTKVTSVLETADRGRGDRRQRRRADVRRRRRRDPSRARRWRCWPSRPRPSATVLGALPVLAQHRAAAHRHLAAAARAAAPAPPGTSVRPVDDLGQVDGHLRPDPAAAARHRHPLPRHPRRRATSSTPRR